MYSYICYLLTYSLILLRNYILYRASKRYKREVCIDGELVEILFEFLSNPKILKKFDYIVNRILEQDFIYYEPGYEQVKGYKNLGEMRLFPKGLNGRIYCKEVTKADGTFNIITAKLLKKKKDEGSSIRINDIFKSIEKYEY